MATMKKSLRTILQGGTSLIAPAGLFWMGATMRRLRLALSERSSLAFICRALDFLCCSLSPKIVLRSVSCGSNSFVLWLRVNDPSHYDLARGAYESVVVKWLRESLKPGDTFLDIGANIGFYSVLAARLIGPSGSVVAIEADPQVAETLTENFEANHLANARALSGAVAGHAGTVRLGRAPASGWTGLYYRKPDEWIEVPAFTGDGLVESLALEKIDTVKIDVEGAEGDVLAGMTDLLTKLRPCLLVEVHRTHAGVEEQVQKILAAHHFEIEILDRVDATMHIAAKPDVKPVLKRSERVQERDSTVDDARGWKPLGRNAGL
jgi:FkbM family methyltransferase